MDTNYPAGTPREGYPVEIQALWFAALHFLASLDHADPVWGTLAEQVRHSVHQYFLLPEKGWLSDCLHCPPGTPASLAVPDDHLRPNQLLAVTLGVVTDREIRIRILEAAGKLLIPGAIRSLADEPISFELPVRSAGGELLNDPARPYKGRYEGDEDTSRKTAYHNGTAWTWLAPSYPEAYFMTYGNFGRKTAKAILSSAESLFRTGCVGQLPEILDGDFPHIPRGCDAQAWGITELYRVWKLLH
jgi:predicted glycogen debranching enzyme